MSRYVLEALTESDIYGYPVTLNFEQNTKYRSPLGGTFSLITICSIVLLCYNGAVSLLNRENSYLSQQTIVQFSPDLQQISFKDFTFFIKAEFEGHANIDPNKQLLNISIMQVSSIKMESQRKLDMKELVLQPCMRSQFAHLNKLNFSEQYDMVGLKDYLCPKPNQQFNLSGMPSSEVFNFVQIRINKCQDFNVCYSPDELTQFIDIFDIPRFKIKYGFTNAYLDTQASFLQPFIYETFFYSTLQNQYTKTDVLLKKTIFNEDWSIIPYQYDLRDTIFYNVPETNIKSQTIPIFENGTLADIYISLGQEYTLIRKAYFRLDTFLAYVGGILQTSIFILGFIVGNYNKFGFYVSLANHLYTFDLKPTKNSDYARQRLNDESRILSLDQLSQRIRERVEKIKNAVSVFQKNTKILLNHNRVTALISKDLKIRGSKTHEQPNVPPDLASDVLPIKQAQTKEKSGSFQNLNDEGGNIVNEEYENIIHGGEPMIQSVRKKQTKGLIQKPKTLEGEKQDEEVKRKHTVKFDVAFEESKIHEERLLSGNSQIGKLEIDCENRRDFLEQSFHDVMKYSRTIRMSGMYLLTRCLCRKVFMKNNERLQLLDKAVKMLKRDTDVAQILEKMQDIDKLKKLILTKDQTMVFNYTPKPVVRAQKNHVLKIVKFQEDAVSRTRASVTQNEIRHDLNFIQQIAQKTQSLLQSKKHFKSLKSYFKLYNAYDRLYHQNKIDLPKNEKQINQKLMHLIGEELRDVFEISYYLDDTTHVLKHNSHNHQANNRLKQHSPAVKDPSDGHLYQHSSDHPQLQSSQYLPQQNSILRFKEIKTSLPVLQECDFEHNVEQLNRSSIEPKRNDESNEE